MSASMQPEDDGVVYLHTLLPDRFNSVTEAEDALGRVLAFLRERHRQSTGCHAPSIGQQGKPAQTLFPPEGAAGYPDVGHSAPPRRETESHKSSAPKDEGADPDPMSAATDGAPQSMRRHHPPEGQRTPADCGSTPEGRDNGQYGPGAEQPDQQSECQRSKSTPSGRTLTSGKQPHKQEGRGES